VSYPITILRPENDLQIAYYSKLFDLQQKHASGFLTIIWKKDPFKAKWGIIAAAYSKIRDVLGKDNASLKIFFALVCPQIGIIAVENYLDMMNWSVQVGSDGACHLEQTNVPDTASFDNHIQTTTMSEVDVVTLCENRGYFAHTRFTTTDIIPTANIGLLVGGPHHPSIAMIQALANAGASPAEQADAIRGSSYHLQPHMQAHSTPATGIAPPAPAPAPAPAPQQTAIYAAQTANGRAFLNAAALNHPGVGSVVFGFNVDQLLAQAPQEEEYEWNGSLADFYNDETVIDFYNFIRRAEDGVGSSDNPASFERLVVDNLGSAAIAPSGKHLPTPVHMNAC
jgi:hypothetical protein